MYCNLQCYFYLVCLLGSVCSNGAVCGSYFTEIYIRIHSAFSSVVQCRSFGFGTFFLYCIWNYTLHSEDFTNSKSLRSTVKIVVSGRVCFPLCPSLGFLPFVLCLSPNQYHANDCTLQLTFWIVFILHPHLTFHCSCVLRRSRWMWNCRRRAGICFHQDKGFLATPGLLYGVYELQLKGVWTTVERNMITCDCCGETGCCVLKSWVRYWIHNTFCRDEVPRLS